MIFGRKARTATEAKREQVEAFEDEPTTDDDAGDLVRTRPIPRTRSFPALMARSTTKKWPWTRTISSGSRLAR